MRVSYDWLKTMIDIPEDPDVYKRQRSRLYSYAVLPNRVAARRCKRPQAAI